MDKCVFELEDQLQKHPQHIDECMRSLVRLQQNAGFGFPMYNKADYTIQEFWSRYGEDVLSRTATNKREGVIQFIENEMHYTNNSMEAQKDISINGLQLTVRKNLWRAFRRIGFEGTKTKGHPDAVNDGCFICLHNTPEIQKVVRIGTPEKALSHAVLMNPFPILHDQVTIASLDHEPQLLTERQAEFILNLTERSKDFKFSFNGIGAGASIPQHIHFYGFDDFLPIEKVACAENLISEKNLEVSQLKSEWPVFTLAINGVHSKISKYILALIGHLGKMNNSVNMFFSRTDNGKVQVFAMPRRKSKPDPSTGFTNEFGVVEMCGMIICESSESFHRAAGENIVAALGQVGYPNTKTNRKLLTVF